MTLNFKECIPAKDVTLHQKDDLLTGVRVSMDGGRSVLTAAWASLLAVLLVQVGTSRIGFATGDEGWLWYGCQRVLAGEWPLRDFNSYDPGRYLLLAGWLRIWHSDGMVPLRWGLALIQWAGLFPAITLIGPLLPNPGRRLWSLLAAVLIALWMAPRHKLIDVDATIWMTAALVRLARSCSAGACRWAAFVAGLFWIIGRNHLLYGSVSVVLACVWLDVNDRAGAARVVQHFKWLAQGYFIGLLPMLSIMLCVRGYAAAYWHNAVMRLVEIGSTNLFLPIPLPWNIHPSSWRGVEQASVVLGFAAIPVTALIALAILGFQTATQSVRKFPLLLASALTTLCWAHQGFSRADLPHLAQASLPLALLLAVMPHAAPSWLRPWAVGGCLMAFLVITLAMLQLNPAFQAYVQQEEPFVWQDIQGEQLYVSASIALQCNLAREVVSRAGPRPSILIAPYFPGLYAEFRLRCPIFDAYDLYPATVAEQKQCITELQKRNTQWAILWPDRMDGHPYLGFDRTHPLVWAYVFKHFQPCAVKAPAGNIQVLHRQL